MLLLVILTLIDQLDKRKKQVSPEEMLMFQETRGGLAIDPTGPISPGAGPSPPELDALSFCLPYSFVSTFPHL